MKKKVFFPLLLLFGILIAGNANAIAFIPPVIYVASMSIMGFIANMFLILAVWLAVKGVINRSYWGKPIHEIVSLFLGWLGTAFAVALSSLFPVLILRPILTREIIVSCIIAGCLCFMILFLNEYRHFHQITKDQKMKSFRHLISIALLVVIISYFCVSLSIKTYAHHINSGKGSEYQIEAESNAGSPLMESIASRQSKSFSDSASNIAETESSSSTDIFKTIWFYPRNSDICIIYFNDDLIGSYAPQMSCYYKTSDNKEERTQCPVALNFDTFIEKLSTTKLSSSQEGVITASGSCNEKYLVTIKDAGFKVE